MKLVTIKDNSRKLSVILGDNKSQRIIEREVTPITKKIRLTNMGKQNARNKAERMTEIFSSVLSLHNRVTAIDSKIAKKANFFSKHKNK